MCGLVVVVVVVVVVDDGFLPIFRFLLADAETSPIFMGCEIQRNMKRPIR